MTNPQPPIMLAPRSVLPGGAPGRCSRSGMLPLPSSSFIPSALLPASQPASQPFDQHQPSSSPRHSSRRLMRRPEPTSRRFHLCGISNRDQLKA
ncbi:hypothetical protein CDD80_3227 [Ophiocordyceps camponoti-rufipedis]|uniref:Uncharacterized protein n=1 Tax=Ophiocordyceps camponoti-rufipedis TaxID=2004952 RepID=A0A2C5Z3D3_9HYPO|nr:hypothetical protein CDD80_3227 [Ophiocordyceps camponoti-rufipedis]